MQINHKQKPSTIIIKSVMCSPCYCDCQFTPSRDGLILWLAFARLNHCIQSYGGSRRHLVEFRVVEEVRSVSVNQGAEGQAILPALGHQRR